MLAFYALAMFFCQQIGDNFFFKSKIDLVAK